MKKGFSFDKQFCVVMEFLVEWVVYNFGMAVSLAFFCIYMSVHMRDATSHVWKGLSRIVMPSFCLNLFII